MAKVNTWLQGASGRVAGMTLYQSGGQTIMREAKSAVKNPQTFAQMVQRVISKTAMNQYTAFQEIANHAFQGKSTGSKCMAQFLSKNMNYMRQRAAQIQAEGGSIYDYYQFAYRGEVKYTPTAAILSEGKLPKVITSIDPAGEYASFSGVGENTYAAVISALRAKRGDQVTFVTVEKDTLTGEYFPLFARVILDPRNSDGTAAALGASFAAQGLVQSPNLRNQGAATVNIADGMLQFKLSSGVVVAAGVILSRKAKGVWLRNSCQLVLNESLLGSDLLSLGAAVDASLSSAQIYTDDNLYLNNAGEGGSQGSSTGADTDSTIAYSNTILLNGVSQDISGGTLQFYKNAAGSEAVTIQVNGRNIPSDQLTVSLNGGESENFTVASGGSSATWTGTIQVDTIYSLTVMRDGVAWFSINYIVSGGGGLD